MAKQTINVGTTANDRTGDPLRTAFTKTNANFTEVYNNIETTNITVANNFITVNDRIDTLDLSDLADSQGVIAGIPRDLSELTDTEGLIANIPADISDLTDTQGLLDPATTIPYINLTNSAFIVQAVTLGPSITFSRAPNTPSVDVIDTGLSLARDSSSGDLYNPELELQYDSINNDSPAGTQWNADGWDDLSNIRSREYSNLNAILGGSIGQNIVEKQLIMHDTVNNEYYRFYFTSWGENNGGSFSYIRRLIQDPNYFEKKDFTSANTVIDIFEQDDGAGAGIGITRSGTSIFNPYREVEYIQQVSPEGTEWNLDGWDDLSNIQTRQYVPFYQLFDGNFANRVPGAKTIMHLPDYGRYYAIQWLTWSQDDGFSYLRYEIDINQINEGVKFPDGTILKTAEGLGRIKSSISAGRRIEEVSGHAIVSVHPITTNNLTTFASRTVTDSSQIYISTANTTIDDILNSPSTYDIIDFSTIQFSIDNSTWYTWGGGTSFPGDPERAYSLNGSPSLSYNEGDVIYFRYNSGGAPVAWWDKAELPDGAGDFRGAIIDYHAYTGDATWIGTIHIVDDSSDEHIAHTEVMSGSTDGENDDLWLVQNEGTIKYRRIDGAAKTLKIHWIAKVFYGTEYYND